MPDRKVKVAEPGIDVPTVSPQIQPAIPTVEPDPGRRLSPGTICPAQKETIIKKVRPATPGEE
ncbi:hypothetical protein LCGC14_0514470 [marine sediment metagenome]|uniref:Uncharacterized protein n=1 Tax=marine sediment metagenome TaxID=412755 RepID=A0A0F9V8H5_9ZZZZ